ncbi:MAG: hypothetical protein ACRENG_22555, partial [bacterium]
MYINKIFFFSILLFLVVLTCARPPDRHQGTRRMAARLKKLAENTDPQTNPFASAERVKYWRSQKTSYQFYDMFFVFVRCFYVIVLFLKEDLISQLDKF